MEEYKQMYSGEKPMIGVSSYKVNCEHHFLSEKKSVV